MGEHRDDLPVVTRSLVTLRRIIKHQAQISSEAAEKMLLKISQGGLAEGNQGVALIAQAMSVHIYAEGAVKEAVLLLDSLRRVGNNVDVLMQVAVEPCMRAMELHKNDVGTYDALTALLAALPLEEDLAALEIDTASRLENLDIAQNVR